ncbi:ABC transporter permease [Candidatus Saccharibacteria bacterium]|nr:ABC transporter permease [Candidatus Saccharibacteria bacterium]
MANLKTVVKFEIMRTIKKRIFWITSLVLPILLSGGIILVSIGSSTSPIQDIDIEDDETRVAIMDESMILAIPSDLTELQIPTSNGQTITWEIARDREATIDRVRTGDLDVFYFIPSDLVKEKVEIFTHNANLMDNFAGNVSALLFGVVSIDQDPNHLAVLTNTLNTTTTNFVDGEEHSHLSTIILSIMVVAILYNIIVMFGSQNLNSMTEEKENRVTEMILTSIRPNTFIWGKIISLVTISFLQVIIMLTPVVIAVLVMQDTVIFGLPLGEILASINWLPLTIAGLVVILVFGVIVLIELLMVLGLMAPTAKAASSWFSVVVILMFLPFFFLSSFFAPAGTNWIATALTLFPFSAPIALPLRIAFGTITTWEFILSIILMAASIVILMRLAVLIFRFGALEYDKTVSLKAIFSRKS